MSEFKFILTGDTHFGKNANNAPRHAKSDEANRIIQMADQIDFVINTGDVTENGYNGKRLLCFEYGGFSKQLQAFQEQYVEPIENAGPHVYIAVGNHDRSRPPYWYQPVFNYVKRREGGLQYTFEHYGIRFICCGMYPKDTKWLRKQMKPDAVHVIFFHYNLAGPWSDWWTQKEKDAFYDVIVGYKILFLGVGHHHVSMTSRWREFNIISGSGSTMALIGIKDKKLRSINFI